MDYQAVFSAVAQLLTAHGAHSHLLVTTPVSRPGGAHLLVTRGVYTC